MASDKRERYRRCPDCRAPKAVKRQRRLSGGDWNLEALAGWLAVDRGLSAARGAGAPAGRAAAANASGQAIHGWQPSPSRAAPGHSGGGFGGGRLDGNFWGGANGTDKRSVHWVRHQVGTPPNTGGR